MTLIALAPLHISSGKIYSAKEFIYENKEYYFPDMMQLYQEISKNGNVYVDKYEKFLLANMRTNSPKARLKNFLDDIKLSKRDFGGYKINENNHEIEKKSGQLSEISQFMRDAYGNPYIPGSSLKGAIRTILINEVASLKNEKAINWGSKKNMNYDDLFHEIYVSDGSPLKNSDLIITQKWDLSSREGSLPKPIIVWRESLKPLTVIKFSIQTNSERAKKFVSDLPEYSKKYYEQYKKKFLNDFMDKYQQPNLYNPIYLGAGSGLWTKVNMEEVDLDSIHKKNKKMYKKGALKLTKHRKITVKYKGKPFKLIENNEDLYEMGKACFCIKKTED